MAKLPSFQFYPGDWQKDAALRRCSHTAKGVWIDMLCLMFECEQRGVLATAGLAWTEEEIVRAVGGDYHITLLAIRELLRTGVARVNKSGAIFSSRMVRDEQIRKVRQESGKKGGNPKLLKQNEQKQDLLNQNASKPQPKPQAKRKQNPTPSSSISLIEKKEEKKEERNSSDATARRTDEEVFDEFRVAYPGTKRGLETELENFIGKHRDWRTVLPTLMLALKGIQRGRELKSTTNQFVPEWKNLQTWINNRCWEEAANESPPKQVFVKLHNSAKDLMWSDDELEKMGLEK